MSNITHYIVMFKTAKEMKISKHATVCCNLRPHGANEHQYNYF